LVTLKCSILRRREHESTQPLAFVGASTAEVRWRAVSAIIVTRRAMNGELCRAQPPNHGRVFKSFLDAYLPDWRDRERRLWAILAIPGV
jgi:hypothetical protein